jgi:hypothetical protein
MRGVSEGLSRDDGLDNVTLYWLTNTAISAARMYWDSARLWGRVLRHPRGQAASGRQRLSGRDLYSA